MMASTLLSIFLHTLVLLIASSMEAAAGTGRHHQFTSILVFGDSTVDTGNNNYIKTLLRANHYPYGKDFPGHVPTGRFSNGKLVPDLIASMINVKDTVPPFLDPNLSENELQTGVCFASSGSGFDDLTEAVTHVIPFSNQLDLFQNYAVKLKMLFGGVEAQKIINGALVVISAGTNDFIINFYDLPTRRLQFTIDEYQDFILKKVETFIKELYNYGCRRIVVSGLPPIGCIPLQKSTRLGKWNCIEKENTDAKRYNQKLGTLLPQIQAVLPGSKVVYADIYTPLVDMIDQPQNYGFEDSRKGCCGSGLLETGLVCNELTPICADASKYVFWDSVHPTEAVYMFLAKHLEKEVLPKLLCEVEHA